MFKTDAADQDGLADSRVGDHVPGWDGAGLVQVRLLCAFISRVLMFARSRWHVPTQATALLLTMVGYFLGHHHHGREFPSTVRKFYRSWETFEIVDGIRYMAQWPIS
jgi:hypothetical protein